jgi:hypothetical protein
MLNPYAIEKDMITSLLMIRSRLSDSNLVISHSIINKSTQLGIPIGEDLEIKCQNLITSYHPNTKAYVCKTCYKAFDDGRKLGGHVSRAHKDSDSGDIIKSEYVSNTPINSENIGRDSARRSIEINEQIKIEFESQNLAQIKEERV